MSEIKTFVDSIFEELTAIRRDIHAHPELGMQEVRTSALIRRELEKMGMDEIQQPLPTAVVGLLHGGKGRPRGVGRTLCQRDRGRDARLRPRSAHHHAAGYGQDAVPYA